MFRSETSNLTARPVGHKLHLLSLLAALTLMGAFVSVPRAEADLLVTSQNSQQPGASCATRPATRCILRYDETTGASLGAFAEACRIEDADRVVRYFGTWTQIADSRASDGTVSRSNQATASAEFPFTGDSVIWLTSRGPDRGTAQIFLDQVYRETVDLYAPSEQFQYQVTYGGLGLGSHIIRVVVTGRANPGSTDTNVDVDAFILGGPLSLTFGPDGNLYVACQQAGVLRYNGTTGEFIDLFASVNDLGAATSLTFGPDGNLFVSNCGGCRPNAQNVLRYDGMTGRFIGVFATGGDLSFPRGLAFGPDGNLYVVSYNNSRVIRYDGVTGAFIDTFVPERSGGLFTPSFLVFGPDGNLYVTGGSFGGPIGAFRYNGQTGDFIDLFAQTNDRAPFDLQFGPDGNLYIVTSRTTADVRRFNGATGEFLGIFAGGTELANPWGLTFTPRGGSVGSSRSWTAPKVQRGPKRQLAQPVHGKPARP